MLVSIHIFSNLCDQADKMLSNIVNILRRFNLEKIPQKWTSEIWDSQFTENPSFDDYEGT